MNGLAIVRVPLRVSLAGGGSDLPGGDGAVVGGTIDKWVYCITKGRDDGAIYLTWREKEIVANREELKHEIVREVLRFFEIETDVEILLFSDVPGVGSGLGSSSATTIATLFACALLRGVRPDQITSAWLARTAHEIEMRRVGRHGGPQDHCVCAHGGLVLVRTTDGEIDSVDARELSEPAWFEINSRLLLFRPQSPTKGRDADGVLADFRDDSEFRSECRRIAIALRDSLLAGDVDAIAPAVSAHHGLKRKAFPLYWPLDAEARVRATLDRQWSYKLCGAGGVGHLLVCASIGEREVARALFARAWGRALPFRLGNYRPEIVHREGIEGDGAWTL